METQKTFHIGIAMAGAVSAGAYTAGVMDYLLEALENWQKAKDLDLPGVPRHEVVIDVLSGASAGGMTAIITAASIQKEFPHINQRNYFTLSAFENPLFNSWVNLTEEPKSDIMSQMLETGDIISSQDSNPSDEVRSVFNSLFIEKIAHRVIDGSMKDSGINRPYFAPDLELLTTLTNLRGFNYELEFITASGKRYDRMTSHKDLLHFQHNPSGEYRNDGKIPYHFYTSGGLNKNLLIDGAIATGAFPAGLAPRMITRDPKYLNDNRLLKLSGKTGFLVDPNTEYRAVCVDGGVINNEPYDLTELILRNRRAEALHNSGNSSAPASEYQMEQSAAAFDTSVLMIDPFPAEDLPDEIYPGLLALKNTSVQLAGAIQQQLMVKSELLERAYNDNDYTRFMIAPVRSKSGVTQPNSIASGSLGGFGGFFSKRFRVHDYMLGRRNCQRFIRQYFCVPESAENPIISYGYANLKKDHLTQIRQNNSRFFPIIPDIRVADNNTAIHKARMEEEFTYPSINLKYLFNLESKVQQRFYLIANNLDNNKKAGNKVHRPDKGVKNYREKSWINHYIVEPFTGYTTNKMIEIGKNAVCKIAARKFIDTVIADFDKRGLLKNNPACQPINKD